MSSTRKKVLVLGGSGFLGTALVEALLKAEYEVVNVDLAPNQRQKKMGVEQVTWNGSDEAAAKKIVEELWKKDGVDAFVGMAAQNPSVESGLGFDDVNAISGDMLEESFRSAVVSNFLFARELSELAIAGDRGLSLVFIGSDYAHLAPDHRIYSVGIKPISYAISKSAVLGMSRYFATRWPGAKVRSNTLSPGGVWNEQDPEFVSKLRSMIPLGRMAQKEEVADAIVFLCSDLSAYFNGQNIIMDGGRSAW